jgi:HNH endonuclease
MPVECVVCSVEFPSISGKARYCSSACAYIAKRRREGKRNDPKEFICTTCGKKFERSYHCYNAKYCSAPCRPVYERKTFQTKFDVLKRDDFRCGYCGKQALDGAELHLDHIVPRNAGGTDTFGNIITACGPCNLSKSFRRLAPEVEELYLATARKRCDGAGFDPSAVVEWFEGQ